MVPRLGFEGRIPSFFLPLVDELSFNSVKPGLGDEGLHFGFCGGVGVAGGFVDGFFEEDAAEVVGTVGECFDARLFAFAKPGCGDVIYVMKIDAAEGE